jgi:predicted protein tyrosine phosphatase
MRSPYAAEWFDEYCQEHSIDAVVKSAGLHVANPKRTQLTKENADWADTIVVMEHYMVHELISGYSQPPGKIINIGIPDIFYDDYEESLIPYDYRVNPNEAIGLLNKGFAEYGFRKHFGKRFFNKILEAKLEDIIG